MRTGLVLLGVACSLAAVLLALIHVPSASANSDAAAHSAAPAAHQAAHHALAAAHGSPYSGPWAFLAVVALCTTGVAAMVVFGGRRSGDRSGHSRRAARR